MNIVWLTCQSNNDTTILIAIYFRRSKRFLYTRREVIFVSLKFRKARLQAINSLDFSILYELHNRYTKFGNCIIDTIFGFHLRKM